MKKILLLLAVSITTSSTVLNVNDWKSKEQSVEKINSYNNLYVLGDSLVDSGAFAGAGKAFLARDFKMDDPCYANRSFTDGPVEVEYLANALNLSLTPGWDFMEFLQQYYQVGNNYAFSGSRILDGKTWADSFYVDKFELDSQCDSLLKQHTLQSNDLVFIETGNNDIMTLLQSSNLSISEKKIMENSYVTSEINTIKRILKQGVQHVMFGGVLNLALTPAYRTSSQAAEVKELVDTFNDDLMVQTKALTDEFPWQNIKLIDFNAIFSDLLKKFKDLDPDNDIENATVSEDTSQIIDRKFPVSYMPGKNFNSLKKDFFFDSVHPTGWVHKQVGNILIDYAQH